jgi:adenosylcobinamide-phosphate synthase
VVLLTAIGARAVERAAGRRGWIIAALALKPTFSLRQLVFEGRSVGSALSRHDLPGARRGLRALVSRPTDAMTESQAASAAIESMAENLSDSVTAPWFYYALFGLAGAAVYRVVNTADAMFGYRGEMEWWGKAAARADDVLSWIPSRLTALALVLAAAVAEGPLAGKSALAGWRADHGQTQSPNAGHPMAAMSGALNRRLEKRGHHALGERRPDPRPEDVERAARIVMVGAGIVAGGAMALICLGRRR